MKHLIKLTFGILITASFFQSCDSSEIGNINNDSILNNRELIQNLKLKETTTYVTSNFQKMGIIKVNVENFPTYKQYTFETYKYFYLNKERIDLENYSFILNNNLLSIKNDDSVQLSIHNNRPYVFSTNYKGYPTKKFYSNKSFNLLLLVMNEILANSDDKTESSTVMDKITQNGGCSSWGTYYVYGTGGSLSVAQANLASEIDYYTGSGGSLAGCVAIGNSNSGCLWEEYGCIATQAFCCD